VKVTDQRLRSQEENVPFTSMDAHNEVTYMF